MTGKICQICGEKSGIYPLCKKHLEMKNNGLVIKDEKTNKWIEKNKNSLYNDFLYETYQKDLSKNKQTQQQNNLLTKKITNHLEKEQKTNCIICGEKTTQNFLFCKNHYNEYKNKSILVKISNCTEIEFVSTIDKYESGLIYTCKDGHRVRSKSEVAIDNYLYDHNIKHAYEKAYPIDNNKDNDLHPDFYLSDYDLYIEHWGYANKDN